MVARRAWFVVALSLVVGTFSVASQPRAATAEGYAGRGGFTWYTTWNEASAAARAQGKVVLVTSTRSGCCLCERFKEETAPQCAAQLQSVAVGYVYNIQRPENWYVDRVLRTNLPGARLMPLVGFLTPDMLWVHGFWGGRNASELLGDIDYVRRMSPARVQPVVPKPAPAPAATAAPPLRAATPAPATPAPATPVRVEPTPPRIVPPPPPPPAVPPEPRAVQPAPQAAPAEPPAGPPTASPPPAAPEAFAPAPHPTREECCPGGKCDIPSPFDTPCREPSSPREPATPGREPVAAAPPVAAPPAAVLPGEEESLPAPESRRLAFPPAAPPAAQPADALPTSPIPGVPDTGALRKALDPRLGGSPDGDALQPAPRNPVARTSPAPAPAPQPSLGGAPERTSSTIVRGDGTADLVQAAADRGQWGEVLRLARGSTDLRALDLERRARQWAQDELARGLEAVLLGRGDEALTALRRVKAEMAGEPAGVDAEHGIDAIETSRDLKQLSDPSSVLARSLRRNKYDELRGTRWARLFEGA